VFKLVMIIECDTCGVAFDRAGVSTDRDPEAWHYLASSLEFRAETANWNCQCGYGCPSCNEQYFTTLDTSSRMPNADDTDF
jgi:hypothetical protein